MDMSQQTELQKLIDSRNSLIQQVRECSETDIEKLKKLDTDLRASQLVLDIKMNALRTEESAKRESEQQEPVTTATASKIISALAGKENRSSADSPKFDKRGYYEIRKLVQNQAAYDLYEESLHGEYKEEFRKSAINFIVSMLPPDLRADKAHLVTRDSEGYLGTDSTPGGAVGGSLIQPILAPMIWRAIINATQTRKISWVLDAPQDIKIPTEQSIGSGGDVAEGGAFVYDDTVFGSESLSPVKHTAGQKYTIEFLQDVEYNFPAITQLILTNLGTRIGIVEEMDFLTYLAGALGPSGNGISTTGVIGTDGVENTGAVTADDITNLYCSIPQIIRGTSIWMLADSILGQVSRLREAGHYMFFPMQKAGMLDATIDVIKGRPVVWNAYLAPAPAAAGGRVGYFGEFNQRLIVGQRSGLQIRPLLEKYLDSEGKIAIIGWLRSACVLTHKNAINYLKLASGYVS